MSTHLLCSPLLRPNGIVNFIHQSKLRQEEHGQVVEIISDGPPESQMPFKVKHGDFKYIPSSKDGHVWLDWDDELLHRWIEICRILRRRNNKKFYYTHCAYSALACHIVGLKQSFIQHESDIYYSTRSSYLSDEWLDQHQKLLSQVLVGCTMPPTLKMKTRIVEMSHYPINLPKLEEQKNRDVFIVADDSYRKGLDRVLNVSGKVTIMSWHRPEGIPDHWDHVKFDFHQQLDKLKCIAKHEYAIIPSRCEVTCLSLLECISQIPVVVFDDEWTFPYRNYVTTVREGDQLTPSNPHVGLDFWPQTKWWKA